MEQEWGQGPTSFLSTVGFLLARMPFLCDMIQEWRTENAAVLQAAPYQDLLDCICTADCDSVATQQQYFNTLASLLAKYLPQVVSVRLRDQEPRDPVQILDEILGLVHAGTRTTKGWYQHIFRKTVTLCLYSLAARPRYARSFAAQEGLKDWYSYSNNNMSFVTQTVAYCDTFVSRCRSCFYAAALSKAAIILPLPIPDTSNAATVQQLFDDIYLSVSNINDLSSDQKCSNYCKGPFEYSKALTHSPYFMFLKLDRLARRTAVKPSEFLVVRFQEAGNSVLHYYLVAFITSKNTISPSQGESGCGVLNLYLNRWTFVSSSTRAIYTFADLENSEDLHKDLLAVVYKRASEKTPLKRVLSKDAASSSK